MPVLRGLQLEICAPMWLKELKRLYYVNKVKICNDVPILSKCWLQHKNESLPVTIEGKAIHFIFEWDKTSCTLAKVAAVSYFEEFLTDCNFFWINIQDAAMLSDLVSVTKFHCWSSLCVFLSGSWNKVNKNLLQNSKPDVDFVILCWLLR